MKTNCLGASVFNFPWRAAIAALALACLAPARAADPGVTVACDQFVATGLFGVSANVIALATGGYRMFYMGQGMQSASSNDGVSWIADPGTRLGPVPNDPVLFVSNPWVFPTRDGRYRMIYEGRDAAGNRQFYSAISPDSLNFTRESLVMAGTSVDANANGSGIIFLSVPAGLRLADGSLRMYYVSDGVNTRSAVSTDDGLTWTPDGGTRLFQAVDPVVYADGGGYSVVYTDFANATRTKRLFTGISSDGLNFTPSAIPIVSVTNTSYNVVDPEVIAIGGAKRLYFSVMTSAGAPTSTSNPIYTCVLRQPPTCTLTATPASINSGGSSTLTATCSPAATSYAWTNTGFAATASTGTVSPTGSTTYSVIGSNAAGSGNAASATVTVATSAGTLNLVAGWNLLGNSINAPQDVATGFGNAANVTTVWKWIAATSRWAFYSPTFADGGAAYAATKGYDFLTTINGGEGFWVNAKQAFAAQPPAGTPILASSFQDQSTPPNKLPAGWSLIAIGENKTPSDFNKALSVTPSSQGVIPDNLNTLWAWDAGQSNWYFYAPSLEAQGGTALPGYITSKGYLDFTANNKTLGPGVGFWVNKVATAPAGVARSALQRNTSPGVSDADKSTLSSEDTAFALDTYRQLLKDPGNSATNVFFSPLSISVALAMTYAGAKGQTAVEMASALHFTLPQDRLHPAFDWLDLELASRGQGALGKDEQPFRLRVSNSLWGDAKSEFEQLFLDTLAQNYGAGMNLVDFRSAPEPSRTRINDWVAQQTEQRIKDLIPQGAVDQLTRLVLVNAVYFNGAWQSKFQTSATVSDTFTKLDGSSVAVDMMNQTYSFRYAAGADYQAVELPYDGGELAMVIILPAAGSFLQFENLLGGGVLQSMLASLKNDYVRLGLPKFRIESGFSLKSTMNALGMKTAFSDTTADFSGISTKEYLRIQDIFHKSFVEIDENGTEAAAATAVVLGTTSLPPPPKIVKVDRPFLFAIVDKKTSAIVFWGRVVDPKR